MFCLVFRYKNAGNYLDKFRENIFEGLFTREKCNDDENFDKDSEPALPHRKNMNVLQTPTAVQDIGNKRGPRKILTQDKIAIKQKNHRQSLNEQLAHVKPAVLEDILNQSIIGPKKQIKLKEAPVNKKFHASVSPINNKGGLKNTVPKVIHVKSKGVKGLIKKNIELNFAVEMGAEEDPQSKSVITRSKNGVNVTGVKMNSTLTIRNTLTNKSLLINFKNVPSLQRPVANTRASLQRPIANTRASLQRPIANTRASLQRPIANTRARINPLSHPRFNPLQYSSNVGKGFLGKVGFSKSGNSNHGIPGRAVVKHTNVIRNRRYLENEVEEHDNEIQDALNEPGIIIKRSNMRIGKKKANIHILKNDLKGPVTKNIKIKKTVSIKGPTNNIISKDNIVKGKILSQNHHKHIANEADGAIGANNVNDMHKAKFTNSTLDSNHETKDSIPATSGKAATKKSDIEQDDNDEIQVALNEPNTIIKRSNMRIIKKQTNVHILKHQLKGPEFKNVKIKQVMPIKGPTNTIMVMPIKGPTNTIISKDNIVKGKNITQHHKYLANEAVGAVGADKKIHITDTHKAKFTNSRLDSNHEYKDSIPTTNEKLAAKKSDDLNVKHKMDLGKKHLVTGASVDKQFDKRTNILKKVGIAHLNKKAVEEEVANMIKETLQKETHVTHHKHHRNHRKHSVKQNYIFQVLTDVKKHVKNQTLGPYEELTKEPDTNEIKDKRVKSKQVIKINGKKKAAEVKTSSVNELLPDAAMLKDKNTTPDDLEAYLSKIVLKLHKLDKSSNLKSKTEFDKEIKTFSELNDKALKARPIDPYHVSFIKQSTIPTISSRQVQKLIEVVGKRRSFENTALDENSVNSDIQAYVKGLNQLTRERPMQEDARKRLIRINEILKTPDTDAPTPMEMESLKKFYDKDLLQTESVFATYPQFPSKNENNFAPMKTNLNSIRSVAIDGSRQTQSNNYKKPRTAVDNVSLAPIKAKEKGNVLDDEPANGASKTNFGKLRVDAGYPIPVDEIKSSTLAANAVGDEITDSLFLHDTHNQPTFLKSKQEKPKQYIPTEIISTPYDENLQHIRDVEKATDEWLGEAEKLKGRKAHFRVLSDVNAQDGRDQGAHRASYDNANVETRDPGMNKLVNENDKSTTKNKGSSTKSKSQREKEEQKLKEDILEAAEKLIVSTTNSIKQSKAKHRRKPNKEKEKEKEKEKKKKKKKLNLDYVKISPENNDEEKEKQKNISNAKAQRITSLNEMGNEGQKDGGNENKEEYEPKQPAPKLNEPNEASDIREKENEQTEGKEANPSTPKLYEQTEVNDKFSSEKVNENTDEIDAKPSAPNLHELNEVSEKVSNEKENKDTDKNEAKPSTPKLYEQNEVNDRETKQNENTEENEAKPSTPKLYEQDEANDKGERVNPPVTRISAQNPLIEKIQEDQSKENKESTEVQNGKQSENNGEDEAKPPASKVRKPNQESDEVQNEKQSENNGENETNPPESKLRKPNQESDEVQNEKQSENNVENEAKPLTSKLRKPNSVSDEVQNQKQSENNGEDETKPPTSKLQKPNQESDEVQNEKQSENNGEDEAKPPASKLRKPNQESDEVQNQKQSENNGEDETKPPTSKLRKPNPVSDEVQNQKQSENNAEDEAKPPTSKLRKPNPVSDEVQNEKQSENNVENEAKPPTSKLRKPNQESDEVQNQKQSENNGEDETKPPTSKLRKPNPVSDELQNQKQSENNEEDEAKPPTSKLRKPNPVSDEVQNQKQSENNAEDEAKPPTSKLRKPNPVSDELQNLKDAKNKEENKEKPNKVNRPNEVNDKGQNDKENEMWIKPVKVSKPKKPAKHKAANLMIADRVNDVLANMDTQILNKPLGSQPIMDGQAESLTDADYQVADEQNLGNRPIGR